MPISGLQIEIDTIDRSRWHRLITEFDDASLFQTWSYGSATGKVGLSHIVVKGGADILGCCQVELTQSPIPKVGIADIHWGPLCMRRGEKFNPDVLFHIMHGIKKEYAIERGYLLRIWPHATGEVKESLKQILESEGFAKNEAQRPYRSLRIDLSPPIDDLRNNLGSDARRFLRRAEENGLNFIEGTNIELFDTLERLAREGARIKKFTDLTDYASYRRTQIDLPDALKVHLIICESQGEPVCAVGCSAIGDTGVYVLAGTGEKAYQLRATYLVQWRMIQQLKERGVRCFDLGPFNPERNPGVYRFKREIAGKRAWEEKFLGEYHGCFNLTGRIANLLLNSVKFLRRVIRKNEI